MFIFLANLKKLPSRMGARDMSRNVCVGENSPNFDEHVMTKQRGALKEAILTNMAVLEYMANSCRSEANVLICMGPKGTL